MSDGGEAQLEVAGELGSIIGDDPIRIDELERQVLVGFHDCSCLGALRELVDRHVQPFIIPDGFWERSQNIEPLDHECP